MSNVIITGGASGIGLAIVKRLIKDGHSLDVLDLANSDIWKKASGKYAEKTGYYCVDITDFRVATETLRKTANKRKKLGALINCAGIMKFENGHEAVPESVRRQIAVNLEAPIHLCSEALKIMINQEEGGIILNISSVAGIKATPKLSVYASTKAGLLHYTKCLAAEYADKKIKANVICPGAIQTNLANRFIFANIQKNIPMGRLQTADEIASLTSWLLSEDAKNVTGAVFSIDGGMSL